ncbi:MTH1187 family thiamine-binding protein [Fulvivirga sp. RKSG066]|uniref:MTH1187 family thiamine-binding protein n=1 Tax=Fulvivirga aurantia TaxID=2529383 RepID=UPI0012BBDC69|nr:MTH1187 family thiamine-binding protein [Fulvivirga aurantia]MTI22855.1 MTH1187 family thiamine-binding protein [Fulvivirga aurantia]
MDHTINAAVQIVPNTNSTDIYPIIDKAIEVIQQSGLKYEVTPMETVIEGKYDEVMSVIKKAQSASLQAGAKELIVAIKLHVRQSEDVSFEEKTEKYK